MKKFILLSILAMVLINSQAQNSYYWAATDTLSVVASGGALPDSVWTQVPNRITTEPDISPMPFPQNMSVRAMFKCDSLSGGYGDSVRVTCELRLRPWTTTSTYQAATADTSKYNSFVIASGTCGASTSTQDVVLTVDGATAPLSGQLYTLVYAFGANASISTRVKQNGLYRVAGHNK